MLWLGGPPVQATAVPSPGSSDALFDQAERLKSTDNAAFRQLVDQLAAHSSSLTRAQYWHLRYLQAWELDFSGDLASAQRQLEDIITHAESPLLQFRARATLVNVLGVTRQYEAAYQRLDELMEALPAIHDPDARFQALGEASQLLTAAGQYEEAIGYARKMLVELPPDEHGCRAWFHIINAEVRRGSIAASDARAQEVIRQCDAEGQGIFADVLRADVAGLLVREGRADEAVTLLRAHYDHAMAAGYASLSAQFNALLARASYQAGQLDQASRYATSALDFVQPGTHGEWLGTAYKVLYEVARDQQKHGEALSWLEKYMAADRDYLGAVSEQALAYQRVRQQLQLHQAELSQLDNQNRILQLQQALDHKAMLASRLSILLLMLVLAWAVLWVYRLKRAQRRFIRLAHHDGLTGIFNRQHFVEQAEKLLAEASREGRSVCLILLDLDHFKLINDSHGHAIGDLVLQRAVAVAHDHLRGSDVFGRLGGEEFGILLPDCPAQQVVSRAEAIRRSIADTSAEEDTRGVVVSASLGIACTATAGYELRRLMANADDALYRAKRSGRDRVVIDGANEPAAESA